MPQLTKAPSVEVGLLITAGFTFLLSSLKAAPEHDMTLRVIVDAHPPHLQMPPH